MIIAYGVKYLLKKFVNGKYLFVIYNLKVLNVRHCITSMHKIVNLS